MLEIRSQELRAEGILTINRKYSSTSNRVFFTPRVVIGKKCHIARTLYNNRIYMTVIEHHSQFVRQCSAV